jgi:hypothetical protein
VLARGEITRTRCGPLPSWDPKIKTFKFFHITVSIAKIKIHENITEEFSYVGRKSYDIPGKNLVFPEN